MRFLPFLTVVTGLLATVPLTSVQAQSAPSNDACTAAIILSMRQNSYGTTIGAADDLGGVVGCQDPASSDHPEVWYAFTATGTQLEYTISPAQPSTPMEVMIFEGTCTAPVLLDTYCGQGTFIGQLTGLTVGQNYLIAVASPSPANGTAFGLMITNSSPTITAAQDCNQAVVLTSGATFSQGASNAGYGVTLNEVTTLNSCFGSQTGSPTAERQSKWFRFTAGTTGPLEFNINPNDPNDDYDWAVWDITTDPTGCTTKGSAIACNWTGARGATGLSRCPSLEVGYQGGDQFDNKTTNLTGANAPIMLQAGNVYTLLVDNFSITNTGFALTLHGACPPQPGDTLSAQVGLDATYTAQSRGNGTFAFSKDHLLTGSLIPYSYFWTFGDGATSTLPTPTHTYAAPNTYLVSLRVTDAFGNHKTFGRQLSVTPLGLSLDAGAQLSLSPNPARELVRLTLPAPTGQALAIHVYDQLGRQVLTTSLPARHTEIELPLHNLPAGIYQVRCGAFVQRLVVEAR